MSPICEPHFSDTSYGFRPNRSCEKAIMKLLEYLNDGYEWIVDIDLEKFFDTVPQDRLMSLVHNAEVEVLESETNLEILLKGWKLVARDPRLRLFVSANLFEIFSNTIWVSSIILVFVTELLNETESYWGYSNTAYSIGIIISGLIAFRLSEKFLALKWESILFSLIAMAIVTLTILFFPNAQMFLVFSALLGMLSQLKEVPETVFLQETVEENNLVNVYSVLEVISTLAFSVFVLLMSYITESFGISISFWLSAICLMIEAILIYIRRDYFK